MIQANTEGEPPTSALLATHFWNYVSNTTIDFPNIIGHHDIEYNPANNTFLTLQEYVQTINGTPTLFGKIVELNSNLWTWDTAKHIPSSEANPLLTTAIYNGTTVVDLFHSNALDWDYNNSVVYLNCRYINTFYKINQTTGSLIWACGQFGNIICSPKMGHQSKTSGIIVYGTKQVAPDVFEMFDN
jgi:hypothetical protein